MKAFYQSSRVTIDTFSTEADPRRFALQNTCSKQFFGKLPGRSRSVLKRPPLQMLPKVARKFPKKIEAAYENSNIFYKSFYADAATSKWPFRSFTLMKSCYSKRYIKPHAPHPLGTHTLVHKINTSEVKIRPVFKKIKRFKNVKS